MIHKRVPTLTVALLLLSSPLLADDALNASKKAFDLRREGQGLVRRAMQEEDQGPLLKQAKAKFEAAKESLLALGTVDAAREQEIVNLNALIFWCDKMMPVESTGEPAPEPAPEVEAPEPESDPVKAALQAREADQALAAAETFAQENGDEPMLSMARYFAVAEQFLGTAASIKAQRRSLALQKELLKRPPPSAQPEPEPEAKPEPTLSLVEFLTDRFRCRVKELRGGKIELFFDFESEAQGKAWKVRTGTWHVTDGKLSCIAAKKKKKKSAVAWLPLIFEGDVELECKATRLSAMHGIYTAIKMMDEKTGYGILATGKKKPRIQGYYNLKLKKPIPGRLLPGKSYRIFLGIKKKTITYKINGKTLYKTKELAPLPRGYVRLSTTDRVIWDEVKVVGTPDPDWLESVGFPQG